MPNTLKYDLQIEFMETGQTKLTTPLFSVLYDESGDIVHANILGGTDLEIPLPVKIDVLGRPKSKVGSAGVKSILRNEPSHTTKRVEIDFIDLKSPLNAGHEDLFQRLKDVLHEYAPENGQYAMHLQFIPEDAFDLKENEIIEPSDPELAHFIAMLNYLQARHH